ncbi:MAG TPA: ATP-binding protein [Acidimicrobiales bacterium]|jgi:anti-sigma regulatory factor (Ser/Thr protein kinase)|nr:ATP-binding protein [Acidimicrobiales bacterium]
MRSRRQPGPGPGGGPTTGRTSGDATAATPGALGTGRVGTNVARRFPPTCASVGLARRFLREQFDGETCKADVEVLALMVSELATNAVQHAETEFEVGIWVTPDAAGRSVLVCVTDAGPGRPARQDPPAQAQRGRGLRIVESLANGWGVEVRNGGTGKTVWFTGEVGDRRAEDGPAPPAWDAGRGRAGEVVSAP